MGPEVNRSTEEMQTRHIEEFSGRDDLGLLREARKVTEIAGDQVSGTSLVSTFYENVVIGIGSDVESARGPDEMCAIPEKLQELVNRREYGIRDAIRPPYIPQISRKTFRGERARWSQRATLCGAG